MRIGELARRASCPVETVRYYEKAGLLPAPRRTPGNYRSYGPHHAERLAFIRRCRSLDMSLPEIRTLLAALVRPAADCGEVNALLDAHIAHVAARVAELERLKSELDAIRAHCSGARPLDECGILQSLAQPAARRARARSHIASAHGAKPPRR
ncbi:MAG: Cd(II)/Pb(II)-responsive transcriptional regulator [Betaproteobacteria bacterium]|nr:Cd(II)/Pb(II)-responsive transcriptional regulator [Betaproteobacteria bacterium]